jgi:diacylglycerol kinase (ATP)
MADNTRYIFIFNPAADKGRAIRKAVWLESMITARPDAVMLTTTHPGHALDIARAEANSCSFMIACGGDGTLHEVVNAVAGAGVGVGVLPIGSANDFVKMLRFGDMSASGIGHLFKAHTKHVDVGQVAYGIKDHRYFINSLGIGFTGRIAQVVKRTEWLKGELSYVHALLSVLAGFEPVMMHIVITLEDSVMELHEPVFAFSVSNGRIEGGKFRIAPEADLTDGLLDICILKAIPKYEFFRYVFKYLKGTQISDPRVIYCKAKAIEVTLEEPETMHMDGEVFENVSGRIAISVMKESLPMLFDLRKGI